MLYKIRTILWPTWNKLRYNQTDKINEFEIDEPLTQELQTIEAPKIPDFNPRRTALFTTTTAHSKLHFYNLPKYRYKIQRDCQWVLEHGYTDLIVNYGNAYGMLALEELLKLQKQGFSFKIYCGKVFGERRSLLHNGLKEVFMVASSDLRFGMHIAYIYITQVVFNVSVISSERSLFYSHRKVPKSMIDYYRYLEAKIYR